MITEQDWIPQRIKLESKIAIKETFISPLTMLVSFTIPSFILISERILLNKCNLFHELPKEVKHTSLLRSRKPHIRQHKVASK